MTGQKLLKSFNLAIAAALMITSVTLPDGRAETPYSATLSATGGGAPYSWSVVSGDLPPDVTLASGGTFAGTPSTAGSYSFTVQAQDSVGALATKFLGMSVALPAVSVSVSPAAANLSAGQTQQFTANVLGTKNTGVAWKVNGVVGGGAGTGSISSIGLYTAPSTIASSFSVTVTAASQSNPSDTAQSIVTLQVPIAVQVSPGSAALPARQAQQFTATVTGTANTAVTWSLNPAVGTISSGGLYSAPPALPGPQIVAVTATSVADTSKQATASVTITPPVTVSLTPTAVTMLPAQGQTFTATVRDTTNTGVTWSIAPATGVISSDGLYTAPSTISATSSVTVAATSVADATKSASAAIALIPPVQITTTSLPGGTAGTAYSATLSATGGVTPYTWSISSGQLPSGTSLSTGTGAISGTPTTAGPYNNIAMKVTDAAGYQATAALAIVIAAASCTSCPGLGITTTSLPAGTVGSVYSATLAGIGGTSPYTWSISAGQLPPGLTLAATGAISGTPSGTGSCTFTAMVTDSASPQKTASQPLAINVTAAPATDTYGGLMTLTSPGGMTGKWSVEKYPTADGNGRWMITTPAGHGLFCATQYGVGVPGGPSAEIAKYGSQLLGEQATLARYTNWGFNCLGEYTDMGLLTHMNAGSLGKQIPYFTGDHFIADAIHRRTMITAQVLPADAVKNLGYTSPNGAFVADGFDPNLPEYVGGFAAARVASGNVPYDPYAQVYLNSYNITMGIDDSDFTQGFGPGPDDCTAPDGSYHPHIGWMALASPLNLYAQWNSSNPYDGLGWIFINPEVYAKNNLVAFLQTEYSNNIASLNAAWGSNYTAFNTAATRYTGEVVGTTNGTQTSLTHTLAHSGVSPGSLLIKVDGTPLITDPPQGHGTLIGRWPDGTTTIGGSINYSNGSLTVSATSYNQVNQASPGTISWGAINLGKTNVVSGTLIMRMEPDDCRIADDIYGAPGTIYSDGGCGAYTVTGTINYAAGTITGFTISPAIPNTKQVQFQYYWTEGLPGAHTVTVDYDVNGWGVGTTLADENGSHTAWLGSDSLLAKANVPVAVWTDLSNWLYTYSNSFFNSTITPLRTYFPGKLITAQFSGEGGHQGCPRKAQVLAMANYADFLTFSQVTPQLLNLLVKWGLGDKPIMDAWEGLTANSASPFSANGPGDALSTQQFANQPLRGAAMAADINAALTGRGSGGTPYQTLGIKFWGYTDTTGERTNYGLVSPSDNAYDGMEATTGIHACSIPLQSYTCGGETANYGDAVTAVRNALAAWMAKVR